MTTLLNTTLILVALIPATAYAGSGYDQCITDETALRKKEASNCSDMNRLFNPSGCYSVQKTLKEYENGKCRKIAEKEGVKSAPHREAQGDTQNPRAQADSQTTAQISNSLMVENERLKAEINRLRGEIESLRKNCQ